MDFKDNDIVAYENQILQATIEAEELKIAQAQQLHEEQIQDKKLKSEIWRKYFDKVSEILGTPVNAKNINNMGLSDESRLEIFDTVFERNNELIRSVHSVLPYSLIKIKPELEDYIPLQKGLSPIQYLNDKSTSRAFEIISEETSENTLRAHNGDIIYWQAWLSAIGFSFKEPISENEILSFAIQHAEGLDKEIDHKLVDQNYKTNLGPHKLSTIKRRIGSLSVFLELAKLPNPCHAKELRLVLAKLTKKYGGSKPNGKAITKDILDDMLETCGDRLIDIRDNAALLFAWGTGGRRRSEVVEAEIKNLTTTPTGEFIYNMPTSKTDQEGKGHHVPIKGRVAKALHDWLQSSQIIDGCIFRAIGKGGEVREGLSAADINRIVKRRLKLAGYDEKQFGAHSLRSGFVTEAGRKNKNIGDVMQLTTHKSITTVMKYYQAGNVINNSAANLAD
jgi:integrase